ncbi:MAG: hypothetical protein R3B99_11500 [Polyangiales bacterium]
MAKVTHQQAGLYDASGRSWEADAALPWLMACATEVATRVVRRVEAQRRVQVGARATWSRCLLGSSRGFVAGESWRRRWRRATRRSITRCS